MPDEKFFTRPGVLYVDGKFFVCDVTTPKGEEFLLVEQRGMVGGFGEKKSAWAETTKLFDEAIETVAEFEAQRPDDEGEPMGVMPSVLLRMALVDPVTGAEIRRGAMDELILWAIERWPGHVTNGKDLLLVDGRAVARITVLEPD